MTSARALPLVSIVVVCKDAGSTIERCLASLLAVDHPAVEIVVQDGGSTDGTREILESFGGRIALEVAADDGWGDAFARALVRTRGAIVGCVGPDAELLPPAVAWAVRHLAAAPELGAVYGTILAEDGSGDVDAPAWNLTQVVGYETAPPSLTGAFFRRAALADLAPLDRHPGAAAYGLWVRVGCRWRVYGAPVAVARAPRRTSAAGSASAAVAVAGVAARIAVDATLPPLVRAGAGRAPAHADLALVDELLARDRVDAAREALARALDHGPDPAWLARRLAAWLALLLAADRPRAALDWLALAAERGHALAGAAHVRAIAHHADGRPDAASEAVRALERDPLLARHLCGVPLLVRALEARGRTALADYAVAVLFEAVARRPALHFELCQVAVALERWDAALLASGRYRTAAPGVAAEHLAGQVRMAAWARRAAIDGTPAPAGARGPSSSLVRGRW